MPVNAAYTEAVNIVVSSLNKNIEEHFTSKVKTGTSVDGILGQFTSQFKFPHAFDTTNSIKTDLGVEGNNALRKLTTISKTQIL